MTENFQKKNFFAILIILLLVFVAGLFFFFADDFKSVYRFMTKSEKEIRVDFGDGERVIAGLDTMTVQVFFPNLLKNPTMQDCSLVYPVERIVRYRKALGTAVLNEVLGGVSKEEDEQGFYSSIPSGTLWQEVDISNGVASVDFNDALEEGVGGSCLTSTIRAQIEKTLMQVPGVERVKISINGDSELILQP